MALRFLDHGGEMGRRIRDQDWSGTPLGALETWPATLLTTLGLCLGSAHPTAVYWGPDLRLLYNDAWAPIPAERHPHCLGQPAAAVWSDIWDVVGPQIADVLATGDGFAAYDQPLTFVRDGRPVDTFFTYSFTPIRDEHGDICGVFNQGNETTRIVLAERNRTAEAGRLRELFEQTLYDSDERLRLALDSSIGIGTWDWDVPGDRVMADARFAALYGVDPDAAVSGAPIATFIRAIHPDDVPRVQAAIEATLTMRTPFIEEYRIVRPDQVLWVAAQGQAKFDAAGRPTRFIGVSFDITRRRIAESAAREAATELRIANQAQAFVHRVANDMRQLDSATAIMRLAAQALGEWIGADRVGFLRVQNDALIQFEAGWTSPAMRPITASLAVERLGEKALAAYRAGQTRVVNDFVVETPELDDATRQNAGAGLGIPLLRQGRWIAGLYVNQDRPRIWTRDEVALAEALAETAWDAVDRAQAVVALAESEAKFRAITNSIDQMVWSALPDGYHDYYNERWYDFTGVPSGSTDGGGWPGMFHSDDRQRALAAWHHSLATGEPYRIEYRLRHRSGDYRWVLASALPVRDDAGRIVRWFGTCTDIQQIVEARDVLARSRRDLQKAVAERTEQLMAAEAQLRQAQKMEAVGQLTGGIAHDFNNMLAVVIGALDLLERRIAQGNTDIARYVEAAREGALRAAALTQRLLSFARRSALEPAPTDLNLLVTGMTDLLRRTLGEAIVIDTRLAPAPWVAHTDRGQVENAILNLAVNARDAMPEGGRLTIETANVSIDDGEAAAFGIAAGDYIAVTVGDTGTGMAADVAARAFDPFFTTKSVGKGTGLGLSQVFGFARQSGGHVAIDSTPGVGTTVRILLPRNAGDHAPEPATAPAREAPRGNPEEMILVVEDEDRVRHYSVEALTELGYSVIDAADGPRALKLIELGARIDLLFTDLVMPEMSGRQLAEAARWHLPGLRVLYTSGYPRDTIEPGEPLATAVLTKPFDVTTLAMRVRDALDGGDAVR